MTRNQYLSMPNSRRAVQNSGDRTNANCSWASFRLPEQSTATVTGCSGEGHNLIIALDVRMISSQFAALSGSAIIQPIDKTEDLHEQVVEPADVDADIASEPETVEPTAEVSDEAIPLEPSDQDDDPTELRPTTKELDEDSLEVDDDLAEAEATGYLPPWSEDEAEDEEIALHEEFALHQEMVNPIRIEVVE
jgi:hypothetical protein